MSDSIGSGLPTGPALWQRAASYASFKHRHQLRKDHKTPYSSHTFRVCLTISACFGCHDETTLAASLLHDTIEDTTTDYDDLARAFGAEVADIVAAATKNMALPEARREREYDEQLGRADWRARLIKLADVYDNLSDGLASGLSAEFVAKAADKARRAITLARGDAARHPETARAIDMLQASLAAMGG